MNAKVGFNEVQAYAKTHNVDFKTAAQKLGLSAQEAAELEKLGGDPGAPVDGFQKKPAHSYTLKSGRKVNVYKDASGKQTFEYLAADGTKLKESYFLKQEGLTGSHFAVNSDGQLVSVKDAPKGDKKDEEKGFWDNAKEFAKNNAGALLAGTAVVVGGALCLTGVAAPVGAGLLAIGAVAGLSSCTTDDEPVLPENINNNNNVNISISLADQRELIAAFEKGIDELLAKMDELGYKVDEYGDKIIDLLVQNNTYLKGISDELENQGKQQEEIIRILTNINTTVDTLSSLVESVNENVIVNGQNVKAQLEEILNAIKSGQAGSSAQIGAYMEEIKALLQQVAEQQGEHIQISQDSNMTLQDILDKLNNINFGSGEGISSEQFAQIIEILESIESIGQDINNKLDALIEKFEGQFPDNTDIKAALERIEQYLKENNDKTDVTNNLLTELLNKYTAGGISEEMLQKLLDAISKNGDKIDAVAQLLAKMQDQDEKFQQKVLEAINKFGIDFADKINTVIEAIENISIGGGGGGIPEATIQKLLDAIIANGEKIDSVVELLAKMQDQDEKFQQNVLKAISELGVDVAEKLDKIMTAINNISVGDSGANIEALIDKVLEKMDANTADIIDAISNIKVSGGGTVDLSSLEKMLSELLELTSKNNSLLESIDGKMDVINLTIETAKEEIIAHLGNGGGDGSVDVSAILAKLDEFMELSNANSEAILTKMDTIINLINNIEDSTYDDTALMAKLDDILAAIKDHNVTVDITGKVTCDCNCGGNHEGILGDLEDVLG